MLFNEIDNFIEVYNNSVIELIQCFGTSFLGQIDHLSNSVIKFRPKNSVPKHCIRSITCKYNITLTFIWQLKNDSCGSILISFAWSKYELNNWVWDFKWCWNNLIYVSERFNIPHATRAVWNLHALKSQMPPGKCHQGNATRAVWNRHAHVLVYWQGSVESTCP